MPSNSPIIISDTSPLFYLHHAGCLDVLQKLYGTILTPFAVEQELVAGIQGGWGSPIIRNLPWINIYSAAPSPLLSAIVDLGRGESEVIALGLEIQATDKGIPTLILDDQLARRIADLYQLSYTGTLGVIIKAKQQGHLKSVRNVIQTMQESGMWLSSSVIHSALTLAGEA